MVSVWKIRLEEAKAKNEIIKILFQYPARATAIIRTGKVLECYDDGFSFQDRFIGQAVYAYSYIAEISGGNL